jgi:hypothetical protein
MERAVHNRPGQQSPPCGINEVKMKSFNKVHGNIHSLAEKVEQILGQYVRKLLLSPLELAVKISGWLGDHHHPLLGWLAIILIIGGSGFALAAGSMALVSLFTGFSLTVIILTGVLGGIVLDGVLIYLDLQVAGR